MGFWSSLLKYGGKAARGTGHVIGVTGKTLGSAALHPQRTLMGRQPSANRYKYRNQLHSILLMGSEQAVSGTSGQPEQLAGTV